jgi:hypothetical protein
MVKKARKNYIRSNCSEFKSLQAGSKNGNTQDKGIRRAGKRQQKKVSKSTRAKRSLKCTSDELIYDAFSFNTW